MDGNKDESGKCIAIARKYIRTGEKAKAIKFLHKAEKLYPSNEAKELINQLTSANGSAASGEVPDHNEGSSAAGTETGPRFRGHHDDTHHEEVKYTQDQVALVRKIQRSKDNYYDILGVTKECTEDDLKKGYRKLALKLHPDKNHAPGATEAFKAVGKAFAVLNDAEKRRHYDLYGADSERTSHHRHHHHHHQHGSQNYYYYDDDDISAEEIFNMFFGGGYPSGRVNRTHRRRTYQHHHTNNAQQADSAGVTLIQLSPVVFLVLFSLLTAFLARDPYYSYSPSHVLLQLSPFLLMILLSMLGSLLIPDSPYNLTREGKYSYERQTKNLGVVYYVKPDFHAEYKGSLRKLEQQIEDEYVSNLRNNCFRERSYKENMAWRARNFGDGRLYEKAQNMKTPSCDKLQQLYGG